VKHRSGTRGSDRLYRRVENVGVWKNSGILLNTFVSTPRCDPHRFLLVRMLNLALHGSNNSRIIGKPTRALRIIAAAFSADRRSEFADRRGLFMKTEKSLSSSSSVRYPPCRTFVFVSLPLQSVFLTPLATRSYA